MARQIGWALAVCVLFASPARAGVSQGLAAQEPATNEEADQSSQRTSESKKPEERRGPWIWWKDEGAKSELKLTGEQVAEIERIFQANMATAKPMRDELTQLETALNQIMRANTADVAVVAQQVDRVESKRAELSKTRVLMLYRIHRVLTAEQNTKFQTMVDRWEAARKKDANPGGRR
ncbi:MAG: Spy/CpxP family protein refolding chaperone [Vicinamibacterales bacterium]